MTGEARQAMASRGDDGSARFAGALYVHLPLEAIDPLDFSTLPDSENRWNREGQRTLYLAGDIGVVLAELGRHVDETEASSVARRVFRIEVEFDRLEDLRTPAEEIGRFVDGEYARSLADTKRSAGCKGLLVPSMAFLDQPDKFNLVVFLENAGDWREWVHSFVEVGGIVVGPLSPSSVEDDVAL